MKISNKTILLIITVLALPSIAVGANCVILGKSSGLSSLIAKLFTWSLRIGGLVVFGALVYGGFLYLISAGDKSRVKEAKSYMTGALIGMVILLGSFLLLNTINPQLLRNTIETEPPNQGICLKGENKNGSSTRCCFSGNQKSLPDGFEPEELSFNSPATSLEGLYWFDSEQYEGSCNYNYNFKGTGNTNITPNVTGLKSFYLDKNKPGVYLYKHSGSDECSKADFPNDPYQLYQGTKKNLGDYKDSIGTIKFKNLGCEKQGSGYYSKISYSAVLHERTDREGACSILGTEITPVSGSFSRFSYCATRKEEDLNSYEVGSDASSITIYNHQFSDLSEGGKITFYEEIGQEGDRFTINASDVNSRGNNYWKEEINYPIQDGDLGGVDVIPGPSTIGKEAQNPQMDHILSIKIEGDFLLLLGKDSGYGDFSFGERCEATKKSIPNLTGHHVLNWPDDDKINAIGIVPIKKALK